ncbi:MAG: hypothetical protein AAFN77_13790 [Planctomycetota bacterium]
MKAFLYFCVAVIVTLFASHGQVIAQGDDLRGSFEKYKNSDEYKEYWAAERIMIGIRQRLSSPDSVRLLSKIASEPLLLDCLELAPSQREEFLNIVKQLVELDKNQVDKGSAVDLGEYRIKRAELISALAKTNMNFQSLDIISMRLNKGIFKAISDSDLLRDYLELSPVQQSSLRRRSNELADRFAEQVKQFRLEAAEILKEELQEEQLKKLRSIYGQDEINDSISQLPVDELIMSMTWGDRKALKSQ